MDSALVDYGLETGIWTSPLVRQIVQDEFALPYLPGHVRKVLRQLGCSVQRPTPRLAQADAHQKRKWVRYAYPNLKKRRNRRGGDCFRRRSFLPPNATLHATWSRRGCQPQIPTRGERNTQKIFGAVRLDNAHFTDLHQEDYFAWETYLAFVEQVLLPAFHRRGYRIHLV